MPGSDLPQSGAGDTCKRQPQIGVFYAKKLGEWEASVAKVQ